MKSLKSLLEEKAARYTYCYTEGLRLQIEAKKLLDEIDDLEMQIKKEAGK